MLKPFISTALLYLVFSFTAPAFAEEEPTMHQVYLAAEAGKFAEAQAMMDKVLHDHPNSAKAHFVEAELLAKQGRLSNAVVELNAAERLAPGLPFAKPEALNALKSRIASVASATQPKNATQILPSLPSAAKDWMPWILLILGIALIVWLIGRMSRRKSETFPANNYSGNARVPNNMQPPVGNNGGGSVAGQPVSGGMGSGLMGSLATGAALGAGVVAGEALMHRFIGGDNHDNAIHEAPQHDASPWAAPSNISDNDDMGGSDFGIADASSWDDDGAGDGGDDWT